jgi:hypothetical protein
MDCRAALLRWLAVELLELNPLRPAVSGIIWGVVIQQKSWQLHRHSLHDLGPPRPDGEVPCRVGACSEVAGWSWA